jgi:hypothetical protein
VPRSLVQLIFDLLLKQAVITRFSGDRSWGIASLKSEINKNSDRQRVLALGSHHSPSALHSEKLEPQNDHDIESRLANPVGFYEGHSRTINTRRFP